MSVDRLVAALERYQESYSSEDHRELIHAMVEYLTDLQFGIITVDTGT